MRFITTLIIVMSFNIVSSFSQANLITCDSKNNSDNSISIFAHSKGYGEYTLKVIFPSLAGYTSNVFLQNNVALVTVRYGENEIIKLTPVPNAITYSFQYQYQYSPGVALRKAPDSSFVYLLPASSGDHLHVSAVSSLSENFDLKTKDGYRGTGFHYKLGDTICAARTGTVYECNDNIKESENENTIYKSSRNKIAIEHKDGSLATYDVLAPIRLLVTPGDYVYPGQPLAVFNKESEKYTLLLSTFYLDEKRFRASTSGGISSPLYFVYMPTRFYCAESKQAISLQLDRVYSVEYPLEIVTAEMSQKEKKKLGYK